MKALLLVLLLIAGPAVADARCDAASFREIRDDFLEIRNNFLPRKQECNERRARGHRSGCTVERPACVRGASDALLELLTGGASPSSTGHAAKPEVLCQQTVLRAGTRYVEHRIRERARGRRRASQAKAIVLRIEQACDGVVARAELPAVGGACAALLVPGEPIPGSRLAYCVRASLERILDDAAPEPLRPNVVLVLTDDQRPETLAFMPAIDRLAEQGVRFTNAFATTANCTPSRASIYSGQYAHNHGSRSNDQTFDDRDTLGPWMSDAGYATGLFGKYRNDVVAGGHVPPGWDEWRVFGREDPSKFFCPGFDQCFYDYVLNENGLLTTYGISADDYSTDVLADHLLEFVERERSVPFFAVYAPYAMHVPALPAPRHEGTFADLPLWRPPSFDAGNVALNPNWVTFARQAFTPARAVESDEQRILEIESLQAVDEAVDDLLSELEQLGLRDNTVVIFTSDHAIHWGEHGWRTKWTAYEESIRVPFVVSHPVRSPVAGTRQELVLNIDIAPTIAELAGAVTGPVDGSNILPLFEGPAPWRSDFLIENFMDFVVKPHVAVRTKRWKYIVTAAPTGVVAELYDLDTDPHELSNLAFRPEFQGVRDLLARRLDVLLAL